MTHNCEASILGRGGRWWVGKTEILLPSFCVFKPYKQPPTKPRLKIVTVARGPPTRKGHRPTSHTNNLIHELGKRMMWALMGSTRTTTETAADQFFTICK